MPSRIARNPYILVGWAGHNCRKRKGPHRNGTTLFPHHPSEDGDCVRIKALRRALKAATFCARQCSCASRREPRRAPILAEQLWEQPLRHPCRQLRKPVRLSWRGCGCDSSGRCWFPSGGCCDECAYGLVACWPYLCLSRVSDGHICDRISISVILEKRRLFAGKRRT